MNARSLLHFPTLGFRVLMELLLLDRTHNLGPGLCLRDLHYRGKGHQVLPPLLLSLDSWSL